MACTPDTSEISADWAIVEPPRDQPQPVRVKGYPYLAGCNHPCLPEAVPFATHSILRLTPSEKCPTPEIAGGLVRTMLDQMLHDYPAILIRDLPIEDRAGFSRFVAATELPLHDYMGGNATRERSDDLVSTTTIEPPEVMVSPHNENCYMPNPPDIIMFYCLSAARQGGEVPVNDVRQSIHHLPTPFLEEMRRRELRYIRRLPRETKLCDVGWQQSFNTNNREDVERYLESKGCTFEWSGDDDLLFWFNTPAFKTYRGEEIWFNQLSEGNAEYWLNHPVYTGTGLTRETCQADTAYGDTGELFSEDVTGMVRGALWKTTELIRMEPSDVIVLDNNIMQHGRMPYEGDRKHLVAVMRWP